jgi:peptidoglycan hydrolase CwlO-like protein
MTVLQQQTQHEFALTRAALQQSTQQHQALQLVTQQLQAQLQTVNAHVDKEREKCSRLEAQIQQLQAQKYFLLRIDFSSRT